MPKTPPKPPGQGKDGASRRQRGGAKGPRAFEAGQTRPQHRPNREFGRRINHRPPAFPGRTGGR